MVDGDPVSFPCLLCIPSSPGTPGINTPCGIDTQPEFYFLLISSPLSLSLPHPYALDSLQPVSFFCLFFFHSAPLFSLFHSALFLSAHAESALQTKLLYKMRMHNSPSSTISRKWYIFKILMLNCLLGNNERANTADNQCIDMKGKGAVRNTDR